MDTTPIIGPYAIQLLQDEIKPAVSFLLSDALIYLLTRLYKTMILCLPNHLVPAAGRKGKIEINFSGVARNCAGLFPVLSRTSVCTFFSLSFFLFDSSCGQ